MDELGGGEGWNVDLENEVIRGSIVLNQGEMLWPPPRIEPSPKPKEEPLLNHSKKFKKFNPKNRVALGDLFWDWFWLLYFILIGMSGQSEFVQQYNICIVLFYRLASYLGMSLIPFIHQL